jgi:uncharacterized protein YjeT (DUF2065 family)
MSDFLVALGLLLAIEGMVFAGFPDRAKRAMMRVLNTPDGILRTVGIACALFGVALIWLVRG